MMRLLWTLLVCLLGSGLFGQFNGGSGSGYSRGMGGGVMQCNSTATLVVHACDSYTLPSGTRTVNVPGTYLDTIPNLANCDSLLTVQLTLSQSSAASLTQGGCDSLSINGQTYTSSGTYIQFLTNTQGCDSVLSLFLSIQPSSAATLAVTSCGPYELAGQTYSSSGTYAQVLTNHWGCDSLVTLQLTVLPFTDSVTQTGNTLTAIQTGATYQWLDCNNGFLPVTGQSSQSFTPQVNGSYAVAIDNGPCADTSACFTVNLNGLAAPVDFRVLAFPNPSSGLVTLQWAEVSPTVEVSVFDLAGRKAGHTSCQQCQSMAIDLPAAAGLYWIQVIDSQGGTAHLQVQKQ